MVDYMDRSLEGLNATYVCLTPVDKVPLADGRSLYF